MLEMLDRGPEDEDELRLPLSQARVIPSLEITTHPRWGHGSCLRATQPLLHLWPSRQHLSKSQETVPLTASVQGSKVLFRAQLLPWESGKIRGPVLREPMKESSKLMGSEHYTAASSEAEES